MFKKSIAIIFTVLALLGFSNVFAKTYDHSFTLIYLEYEPGRSGPTEHKRQQPIKVYFYSANDSLKWIACDEAAVHPGQPLVFHAPKCSGYEKLQITSENCSAGPLENGATIKIEGKGAQSMCVVEHKKA